MPYSNCCSNHCNMQGILVHTGPIVESQRGNDEGEDSYRPRLVMIQEAIQGAGLEGALVVVD